MVERRLMGDKSLSVVVEREQAVIPSVARDLLHGFWTRAG
jgi:hypothetical protein